MERDKQIFALGFSCGQIIEQECIRGIHDEEIKKYMNAIEWYVETMSKMYDKIKEHYPEVFDKTINL